MSFCSFMVHNALSNASLQTRGQSRFLPTMQKDIATMAYNRRDDESDVRLEVTISVFSTV